MQAARSDNGTPFEIAGCRVMTLDSHHVGDRYRVHIARPEGEPPADGWPLLVLLDSDTCFATCVETMRRMARRTDATGAREIAIVGVSSANGSDVDTRKRDYTTPLGEGGNTTEHGAGRFLDFLAEELLPFAHDLMRVNQDRQMLLGHSLAGYFALWTMCSRPGLFDRHIALSPSLWWDGFSLLETFRGAEAIDPRTLLCVGEWEEALAPRQFHDPGRDRILERRRSRRMIGSAVELGEILNRREGGRGAEVHVLDGEDHASIVTAAMPRVLRFVS
ncbi:alpha/beta hydrolase [Pelagerythrobacter sp.]|uniref:alpha/beta hydrolase n=1 Tax=Pelagerythrobacter sp. TaxID=2800702 RepID=UPI0035AF92FF